MGFISFLIFRILSQPPSKKKKKKSGQPEMSSESHTNSFAFLHMTHSWLWSLHLLLQITKRKKENYNKTSCKTNVMFTLSGQCASQPVSVERGLTVGWHSQENSHSPTAASKYLCKLLSRCTSSIITPDIICNPHPSHPVDCLPFITVLLQQGIFLGSNFSVDSCSNIFSYFWVP